MVVGEVPVQGIMIVYMNYKMLLSTDHIYEYINTARSTTVSEEGEGTAAEGAPQSVRA